MPMPDSSRGLSTLSPVRSAGAPPLTTLSVWSVRRCRKKPKPHGGEWSEPGAEPNAGVSLPLSPSAGLTNRIHSHGHAEPVTIIESDVGHSAGECQVDEVIFTADEEPWCEVNAGGLAEPVAIPHHWSIPVAIAVGRHLEGRTKRGARADVPQIPTTPIEEGRASSVGLVALRRSPPVNSNTVKPEHLGYGRPRNRSARPAIPERSA